MPKNYEEKRDFDKTPEPKGAPERIGGGPLRFVVQKHAARNLHYDLRLEIDGALASWAVPKGPSLNPKDKHLAVHVEDHPLSYASFEGQIPKGEYGGGEIIVWDQGVYSPDDYGKLSWDDRVEANDRMRDGVKKGKLSFTLRGTKLNGSWTLVKTARSENEWLLIKHKDENVSETRDILKEDRSVLSGRTVEDVAAGRDGSKVELDLREVVGAVQAAMPRRLDPMTATEVEKPFTKQGWLFEVKLDGIRVLAIVENRRVKLLSRNAKDITAKFPALVRELAAFPHDTFILDGEVVIYDEKGVPSFQGLMERFQRTNPREIDRWDQVAPVEYCVFDLLFLDGWDLRQAPLSERRNLLVEAGFRGASTRVMDAFPTEGELVFEQAKAMGFEGVVAKKLDSRYKEGTRSQNWVKIKGYHSDDFFVAGYTKGEGMRRSTFGSLILGSYENGTLVYQGNVGGGFSDAMLEELRAILDEIRSDDNPFGGPISAEGEIHWVQPKLCAEVQYMTRTREGRLRFPVFLRLRPDVILSEPPRSEAAVAQGNDVESILEQLGQPKNDIVVTVEGEQIRYSSLDKVLWPAHESHPAVTKRDLAVYYAKISQHMLPHLKDRPLSFVRCPDGITGEHFFQKHYEKGLPDFVDEVAIWSSHNKKSPNYVMVNNLPTLMWLAQVATLEIHPWYSRVDPEPDARDLPTVSSGSEEALDASVLNYPDFMVVDLDPNVHSGKEKPGAEPEVNEAGFKMAVEAALGFKQVLDDMKLTGYLKTSGKTGLHVYIPIARNLTYDVVRPLCEVFGRHLMQNMPDIITMEWVVSKRPNKIFFDHNQNVRGKTLVSIFSPRPVPGAPVSIPIEWSQLKNVYPMQHTLHSVPASLAKVGDRWRDILERKQDLHSLLS